MTKEEIAVGWLKWLRGGIYSTIENQIRDLEKEEVDIDWLIHYLQESIEYDLGKFGRGLRREVSRGNK